MDTQDNELVSRIVSHNDTQAFGELIRRHQSHVRNFLRKLSGDAALADDLAQDCFLHAWDKMSTYSGSGTFIGWLLKVAYTTFLQSKRRSKRYAEILTEVGQVAEVESKSYTQDNEEVTDLDKLLAILDEDERAIMVMSYACGLSHREISDATDMPVGTVKSVIHRSKEKIRSGFELNSYQHG
jgi:RNA polymerase sigma-70 factor (ECF subfamily)